MAKFLIQGGYPIHGEITPIGNKNAIFPVFAATLLASDVYTIKGVPDITDVHVVIDLLAQFGVVCSYASNREDIIIDTRYIHNGSIDPAIFAKIRGSVVLLGALVSRFGKIKACYPGGDKIGERSLMAHFDGFMQLGYRVEEHPEEGYYMISKKEEEHVAEHRVFLYEPSVTATENIILASAIGTGGVIIDNAACEPHISDLCSMLCDMGAHITGFGTNRVTIFQSTALRGVDHTLTKDIIYIGTFIIFALVTHGDIAITDVSYEFIQPILVVLKYFSIHWKFEENRLYIPVNQHLALNKDFNIYSNVGIYSQPWPQLPTDLLSIFIALATQSQGEFLFFEKMFENRIEFAYELIKMNAHLELLDSHRLKVYGKTDLVSTHLTCPDIRTGILYLAAMLAAGGESTLDTIDHIERGYPNIETTLSALGAHITKYEETF